MKIYTAWQLLETALYAGVLFYGVLDRWPSIALVGGGLLMGKAVLNILAPEGGTVRQRSFIGYLIGLIFAVVGIVLVKVGL